MCTVLLSTRVQYPRKRNTEQFETISLSEVGKEIEIYEGFCLLKMIKCRRRQAIDPQELKNCQQLFFGFLLVEAETEVIGVEAVDKIAFSTSLVLTI